MAELAKAYDPHAVERKRYEWWEKRGYFHADSGADAPPASITIPPPNVTGTLHMGHALQHSIHDTLTRWARMRGHNICVVPGVDHAGIGTQIKVSEHLFKTTGLTPGEIGREDWLRHAEEWAAKNGGGILKQLRLLGCSYDWRRERYTLDEGYYQAVLTAFRHFFDRGWIYRGERMVNWCPECRTVISDLEVEQREITGKLYTIRYPGIDGAPDVTVTTTRPETMLGDTAVAVHPSDQRWQAAVGKQVMLPLMERPIPIVADEYPDPEFGSGAVKVTPAHDPNDWEIGQRHDLPVIRVIDEDGKMAAAAGKFAGMRREEARRAVLRELEQKGLLVQVLDYTHAVPHHDRCHTVIEPLPMEQWFLSMRELADNALGWYRDETIQFHPDRFREYGIEWLENIRDWCISRQLWWGHRIPIYYGENSGKVVCALTDDEAKAAFGDEPYRQEEDVLDTWFSSALWPFAVLGWPNPEAYAYTGKGRTDAGSLETFHPTTWMITGRDILYLWVARMAMTAKEFVGEVPFEHVVVHPTIQTREGQRMSRSLGTGIDPLELIDQYGTDVTRLMLLFQCSTTQDIRFDAEIRNDRVEHSATAETCRNFLNKIWNASRFVLMNLGEERPGAVPEQLGPTDQWLMVRYQLAIIQVTEALEAYRFDEAVKSLYEFIWSEYCDWYIELAKPRLRDGDPVVRAVLWHVLEGTMRLLQPFAPFIAEEIWQELGADGESCMVASWPEVDMARLSATTERPILHEFPAEEDAPVVQQPTQPSLEEPVPMDEPEIASLPGQDSRAELADFPQHNMPLEWFSILKQVVRAARELLAQAHSTVRSDVTIEIHTDAKFLESLVAVAPQKLKQQCVTAELLESMPARAKNILLNGLKGAAIQSLTDAAGEKDLQSAWHTLVSLTSKRTPASVFAAFALALPDWANDSSNKIVSSVLKLAETEIKTALGVAQVEFKKRGSLPPDPALSATLPEADVYLPLAGLVDLEAERARLTKERDKAKQDLEAQRKKLGNEQFTSKAPDAVVQKVRDREAELAETVTRLDERIAALGT